MNTTIKYVKDHGDLKKERIVISILNDTDIGNYIIFDTTYLDDNQISNLVKHSFWFPDQDVERGDYVILYTKKGKNKKKKNLDNSYSHFFYWGLEKTIWNQEEDAAVIAEIRNWTHIKV